MAAAELEPQMLRKLILIGAVAGVSASFPILYETNPGALESLLGGSEAVSEEGTAPRVSLARRAEEQPRTEQLAGRRVRLASDRTGHFGADFKLNGRAVPGVIDTGATLVAINMTTARRIGLDIAASDFNASVDTANGRTRAAIVTIDRLEIGRISMDGVDAVVLDDKALGSTLIGMSFMKRLKRYHVENGALVLEQ